MRLLARKMLTLLMAVLVLVTSTGFGVAEHTCAFKGKSKHFVFENASCQSCPASKPAKSAENTQIKKTACCGLQLKYEKVDVSAHFSFKNIGFSDDSLPAVLRFITQDFVNLTANYSSKNSSVISFSSRLFGRGLLVFGSIFVI